MSKARNPIPAKFANSGAEAGGKGVVEEVEHDDPSEFAHRIWPGWLPLLGDPDVVVIVVVVSVVVVIEITPESMGMVQVPPGLASVLVNLIVPDPAQLFPFESHVTETFPMVLDP